jgi:hypothetical protein
MSHQTYRPSKHAKAKRKPIANTKSVAVKVVTLPWIGLGAAVTATLWKEREMLHKYRFVVEGTGASQSDLDQWLANHATRAHATLQHRGTDYIAVYLDDDRDRLKLLHRSMSARWRLLTDERAAVDWRCWKETRNDGRYKQSGRGTPQHRLARA